MHDKLWRRPRQLPAADGNIWTMTNQGATEEEALVQRALAAASDTRFCAARPGVRDAAGKVFASQFAGTRAIVVADENTFMAAGRDVQDSLTRAGVVSGQP